MKEILNMIGRVIALPFIIFWDYFVVRKGFWYTYFLTVPCGLIWITAIPNTEAVDKKAVIEQKVMMGNIPMAVIRGNDSTRVAEELDPLVYIDNKPGDTIIVRRYIQTALIPITHDYPWLVALLTAFGVIFTLFKLLI